MHCLICIEINEKFNFTQEYYIMMFYIYKEKYIIN
jgi:hypothetical protein